MEVLRGDWETAKVSVCARVDHLPSWKVMCSLSVMESVSADDARCSLDSIDAARSDVAERIATPIWYYPLLGLLVAQMVLVYGFVEGGWPAVSAVAVAVGSLCLVRTSAGRTGLAVGRPVGRRSGAALVVFALGMMAPLLFVVLIKDVAADVVVALSLFVFLSTVVLGPVYDAAYRADLRHRAPA